MRHSFRDIIFDDFTQPELKEIWTEMAGTNNWRLEPTVAEVASRRVSRGRGVKGFANARSVRRTACTLLLYPPPHTIPAPS